jgi:hypothetical protein
MKGKINYLYLSILKLKIKKYVKRII